MRLPGCLFHLNNFEIKFCWAGFNGPQFCPFLYACPFTMCLWCLSHSQGGSWNLDWPCELALTNIMGKQRHGGISEAGLKGPCSFCCPFLWLCWKTALLGRGWGEGPRGGNGPRHLSFPNHSRLNPAPFRMLLWKREWASQPTEPWGKVTCIKSLGFNVVGYTVMDSGSTWA